MNSEESNKVEIDFYAGDESYQLSMKNKEENEDGFIIKNSTLLRDKVPLASINSFIITCRPNF